MIDRKMLKSTFIVMPIAAAATLLSLRNNLSSIPVMEFTTNALRAVKALLLPRSGVVALAFAAILFVPTMRDWLFQRLAKQEVPVTPSTPAAPIRI